MNYSELRFATTPLVSTLSNKPENPLNYKASGLVDNIYKQLGGFVNSDINTPTESIGIKDWDKYKKLVVNYDPNKLSDQIQHLGDQEALDYSSSVVRAVDHLKSTRPARTNETLMGIKELEPSDNEKLKWLRQVSVVDNPLSVIGKMKSGTLQSEELETLQIVYPEIYNLMQRQVVDILTNKKEEISLPKQRELSKLLQVPYQSADKTTILQSSFQNKQEASQPMSKEVATPPSSTQGTKMGSSILGDK